MGRLLTDEIVGELDRGSREDERRKMAEWLAKYDTYSQYTGRDLEHLVRRLDIPNEEMQAIREGRAPWSDAA